MTPPSTPEHDSPQVAALRAEIEHLRARSAEAAALRGELLTQRLERQGHLDRLHRQVARLAAAVNAAQDKEVRQLRAQLQESQESEARARRRAERLREQVRALESSRSHRAATTVRRTLGSLRPGSPEESEPARPAKRARKRAAGDQGPAPTPSAAPAPAAVAEPPTHSTPLMLDCRGLTREEMVWALDEVRSRGDVAGLDVVVLIDSVHFDLPRSRGHLVEYVPPEHEVEKRVGADEAARLGDTRWNQILDTHLPQEVYGVDRRGDDLRLDLVVARPDTA